MPWPYDRLAKLLKDGAAPVEVLERYIGFIPEAEKRFELAAQYHCTRAVVEACKVLKDRERLIHYQRQLSPGESEHNFVGQVLAERSIKWR